MSIFHCIKSKLKLFFYLDILAPPIEFTNNGKSRSYSVVGVVFSLLIFIISILSAQTLILNIITNSNPKVTIDNVTIEESYSINFNETLKNSFFFQIYSFSLETLDTNIIETSELEPVSISRRTGDYLKYSGAGDALNQEFYSLEPCSEEFIKEEYLSSDVVTEQQKNNNTYLEELLATTLCFPYLNNSEIRYYNRTSFDVTFSFKDNNNSNIIIVDVLYKHFIVDRNNFNKPYKILWMDQYYFIDFKKFNSYFYNVHSIFLDVYDPSFILENKRNETIKFGTLKDISSYVSIDIPEILKKKNTLDSLQLSFTPTYQSSYVEIKYTTYDELLSTLGGTFTVVAFFFQYFHEYFHDCFFKANLINSVFLFHQNDYLNEKEKRASFHENTKINFHRNNSNYKNDIKKQNENHINSSNSQFCDSNLQVNEQNMEQNFEKLMLHRAQIHQNLHKNKNDSKMNFLKKIINKLRPNEANNKVNPEFIKLEIIKKILSFKSQLNKNFSSNIENGIENKNDKGLSKAINEEVNNYFYNNEDNTKKNELYIRKRTTSDSDTNQNIDLKNTYKSNAIFNTNDIIKEIDNSDVITINSINNSNNNHAVNENIEVKLNNKNNTCKNLYYHNKYKNNDNFILPVEKRISDNNTINTGYSKFNDNLKANLEINGELNDYSKRSIGDLTNTVEMKYDDILVHYGNNIKTLKEEDSILGNKMFNITDNDRSNKCSDSFIIKEENSVMINEFNINIAENNFEVVDINNPEKSIVENKDNTNNKSFNSISIEEKSVIKSNKIIDEKQHKENNDKDSNNADLVNCNNQSQESNILLNKKGNKLLPIESVNVNYNTNDIQDNKKLFNEIFQLKKSRTANHISCMEAMTVLGCCGCFSNSEKYEKHNLIIKACSVLENKLNINNYFNLFFDIEMMKRMVILMSFSLNHLQTYINETSECKDQFISKNASTYRDHKDEITHAINNVDNGRKVIRRKLRKISSSNFIDEYIVKSHTKMPGFGVLNNLFSVIKLITPPSYSVQNQYSGDKLLSDYNNKEINQEYWNNSVLDVDILNACFSNIIEGNEKSEIHPTSEIEMILLSNVLDSIL